MYTTDLSRTLKTFVYAIVILLILCSGIATLGFMFADMLTFLPFSMVDFCVALCAIANVLLITHIITFVFVLIFQIARLTDWFGYIVLSLFAIGGYIEAWFTTPERFEFSKNLFGF